MTPVSKDTLSALTTGINSEIATYVFYVEAAKQEASAKFRSILEDLAREEKKHFQILERQHNSLIKSEQWISLADVLKSDDLPEINEDMSSTHRGLIDKVRQAHSAKQILDIAYRLEEEAFALFDKYARKADSDVAKKIYTELSKFEQGHMRKIDEMRKKYS
jgi:rubrerythrin